MTIDCNGIPGVIAWLIVVWIAWFALDLPSPWPMKHIVWKVLWLIIVGYLVFFYAFR